MLNGGAWGPPLITVDSMHISGCPMGCIHRSKIVEVENSTQAGRTHRGCNKKFSLRSSRSTLHSTRTCNGVDGPAKADHAGLQYRTRVVPITCWWGFLGGKVPDYWKSENRNDDIIIASEFDLFKSYLIITSKLSVCFQGWYTSLYDTLLIFLHMLEQSLKKWPEEVLNPAPLANICVNYG